LEGTVRGILYGLQEAMETLKEVYYVIIALVLFRLSGGVVDLSSSSYDFAVLAFVNDL
jgi:hypothetical protein